MIRNSISAFIIILVCSISLFGQRYPHGYKDYYFLNKEKNKIDFFAMENWNQFFGKIQSQWLEGNKQINIIHFGGSHIQADVWSNRLRQHFQNISPNNNSGRGMLFPFRLIGSNGSAYLKTSHTGKWKGYRNSVSSHQPPFGLMGARGEFSDSSSKLSLWVNKEHCTDCYFDQLEVFYIDSSDNFCIEIINDSVEWIKENSDLGSCSFKLSKAVDSLNISFNKLDSSFSVFHLYGLKLINENPGILYHSVGVNGASVPSYLRSEYLPRQLGFIEPDLVIFSIGINDAYEPNFTKENFIANYDSIIQIVKQINPFTAILFTTNNDSYYQKKFPNKRGQLVKEAMYELAEKHNAAVWDFYEVMGGFNSIATWEKYGLAKRDKIHLTTIGYKLVGDLLFEAFLNAYKDFIVIDG